MAATQIKIDQINTYNEIYGLGFTDERLENYKQYLTRFHAIQNAQLVDKTKTAMITAALGNPETVPDKVTIEYLKAGKRLDGFPVQAGADTKEKFPRLCVTFFRGRGGGGYYNRGNHRTDFDPATVTEQTIKQSQEIFNITGIPPSDRDLKDIEAFKKRSATITNLTAILQPGDADSHKSFEWLTGIDLTAAIKEVTDKQKRQELKPSKPYLAKIVKVVELPNQARLGFFIKGDGTFIGHKFFEPGKDKYDYIDEGRELIIHLQRYQARYDYKRRQQVYECRTINETSQLQNYYWRNVIFFQENTEFPEDNNNTLLAIHESGERVFDTVRLRTLTRAIDRKYFAATEARRREETKQTKLEKKLKQLAAGKTKFKQNSVEFSKEKIIYEGQELSCTNKKASPTNILTYLLSSYRQNLEEIRFDRVFDTFVSYVNSEVQALSPDLKNPEPCIRGTIGDVAFRIVGRAVGKGRRVYINNHRINMSEVDDVLRQALCFTKQETFDDFLSTVSKCSLAFNKLLAEGIKARVHDPFLETDYNIKLPVIRRNGKNYLLFGEKDDQTEYKIKSTSALASLAKNRRNSYDGYSYRNNKLFNVLLSGRAIDGLAPKDLKYIVEEGKKEFKRAEKKSLELLEKTIKTLGVTEETHHGVKGYVVKGTKSKYFLSEGQDRHTGGCEVRTLPGWNYVCIVDKSLDQAGADKIVNRMFALKNDALVANKVHTLNRA